MIPQIPTATKILNAPADVIYNILADYRTMHWLILPKQYYLSLDVEEGGIGVGTIVNFEMSILGETQSFRSLVTEPEPGRRLVETDLESQTPTLFYVLPITNGEQTRVTISTELKGKSPVEGWIASMILQKIYREELELLAQVVEEQARFEFPGILNKSEVWSR